MFAKFSLNFPTDIFDKFSKATVFEDIVNGRTGAIMVDTSNRMIQIVRTTTMYDRPVQSFAPIHYHLINA